MEALMIHYFLKEISIKRPKNREGDVDSLREVLICLAGAI